MIMMSLGVAIVLPMFFMAVFRLLFVMIWLSDRRADDRYGYWVAPTKHKWCRIGVHNWRYNRGEHRWDAERVCSNCDTRHIKEKHTACECAIWIQWGPTQPMPRAQIGRIE